MPSKSTFTTSTSSHRARFVLDAARIAAPVLFMSFFLYNKSKKITQQPEDEESPLTYIQLFPSEATFYKTDMPCISTLTWFNGDYKKAQEFVQRRLAKILQTNPWLTGRIVKRRGMYYIAHSSMDSSSSTSSTNQSKYFEVVPEKESPISREQSPLGDLGTLTKKYMIRNGPHEPLFKVTVIPCQTCPESKFALICQMSHVAGDGATFYKIHELLCSSSTSDENEDENKDEDLDEIELIVDRVDTFDKDSMELLGRKEHGFITSPSYICLLVRGMLKSAIFGPKTEFKFAFVDHDKIQQEKETFLATKNTSSPSDDKDCVSFISTNDIITSWFMSNTGSAHGIMPINLRNRLKGITSSHVGNYENVIYYQCPTDAASPSLIRQSIQGMKRVVTTKTQAQQSFPGFWDVVGKKCAIVTNWQTFAKPNVIPGCEEDLHLPIAPISVWASTMPFLLVFRAGGDNGGGSRDRMGVCLFQTGTNYLSSMPFLSKQTFK